MVAIGVNASAWFIIAANSWMQHPVGAQWNAEKQRPELKSLWDVMTNSTTLAAFPHTIAGAFLTAGTFVAGIGCWWMVRNMRRAKSFGTRCLRAPEGVGNSRRRRPRALDARQIADQLERDARTLYRPVTRLALWIMIISGIALAITGDLQAKLMFKQQPMKMASAESLCRTETGAGFSILAIGTQNNCESVTHLIEIPNLLSFLADNNFDSTLQGVEELQAEHVANFGPGNYKPNLFVTYWAFRAMMGWAVGSARSGLARALVDATRTNTGLEEVRHVRDLDDPDPVLGQQFWLDLHRDGQTALDGGAQSGVARGRRWPGEHPPDGARGCEQAFGLSGAHVTDHLHVALRSARTHLVHADP